MRRKTWERPMRFANWFAAEWKFADQLQSGSSQIYWFCNSRKLTQRCSPSKPKVLCCAANFNPSAERRRGDARRGRCHSTRRGRRATNGVIADCWREFTGSRSIGCARKFSRSRFRISIDFFSHGSEPTRNIGSKVWKACNPSWNNSTGASCHWLPGNRRCFRRALPITILNGSIVFVFPVALAGDV